MPNLLSLLEADVVSLILTNLLIYDVVATYDDFIHFFLAWEFDHSRMYVKYVIEKMDWEMIYDFDKYAYESSIPRFYMFVEQCAHIHVVQACYFNSSKKLLKQQSVQHHLSVLHNQSTVHFPSYFNYLVFKAIYRPFELSVTVKQMFEIVKNDKLKYKVWSLMYFLASLKDDDEGEMLMPVFKFCPNSRHPEPFYVKKWPPWDEDIWNSLCNKVVQEDFNVNDIWSKTISIDKILHSNCEFCTMQIIVYKVLLNDIL